MPRSHYNSCATAAKLVLLALALLALVHHDHRHGSSNRNVLFSGVAANDEQEEAQAADEVKPEFKLGVYECENVGGALKDQAQVQKPKEQGSTLQLCIDVIEPEDIAIMKGIQSLKLRMRGRIGDSIHQAVMKNGQLLPETSNGSTIECSEMLCFLQIPLQVQFFMTKGFIDMSGKAKVATSDGKHQDFLPIKYSFEVVAPIPESIQKANDNNKKEEEKALDNSKKQEDKSLDYDPNDPYDHPVFQRPDPRTVKHEYFKADDNKPFPANDEILYWVLLASVVALLQWSFSGNDDNTEEQKQQEDNKSSGAKQPKKVVKKKIVKVS